MPPRKLKIKTKKAKHPGNPKQVRKKSARRHSQTLHPIPGKLVGKLFEDLVSLQARLRAPGGCPWDRQQTHATLKTYLIEEAYEVLDALENGNANEMAEELGDLLLQVLFHADLAREAGSFDISHVISGIHNKMVRRHPHVFGNAKADTPDQVLKNWAKLKATEKRSSLSEAGSVATAPMSFLDGVPRSLPAILEAYQLTRRASQVGFDWDTVDGIFDKLHEESEELRVALDGSDRSHLEEEVGDIFFVAVNLARFLSVDPEVALKKSNLKFKHRFQGMEVDARNTGKQLDQLSKQELEDLWEASKARIRKVNEKGAPS